MLVLSCGFFGCMKGSLPFEAWIWYANCIHISGMLCWVFLSFFCHHLYLYYYLDYLLLVCIKNQYLINLLEKRRITRSKLHVANICAHLKVSNTRIFYLNSGYRNIQRRHRIKRALYQHLRSYRDSTAYRKQNSKIQKESAPISA